MKILNPKEYKLVALRECPTPESMQLCDEPEKAAEYWRLHVTSDPRFDPDRECLVALLLTTRRRVKGHVLISIGTIDSLLVRPADCFRIAVASAAASVILLHNHPSGQADPSEADIKITRDLIRAGQLLKIDVLDHIIIGAGQRVSLRELGYFSL